MWRKASAAALLALTVGYFYHATPDLPGDILQYITTMAPFQSDPHNQNSMPNFEQAIATAWDALITMPTRQWSKVAVG